MIYKYEETLYNFFNEIVYVDGISSQGTSNRTKILQKTHPGSIAIGAEDFLKMKQKIK